MEMMKKEYRLDLVYSILIKFILWFCQPTMEIYFRREQNRPFDNQSNRIESDDIAQ